MYKISLICFLFFSAVISSGSFAQNLQEQGSMGDEVRAKFFHQGIEAYQSGKFQEASQFFEEILSNNFQSPHIVYNLANSYYQSGQFGKAIATYLRAQMYLPRDHDLTQNLNFARKQIIDRIEPTSFNIFVNLSTGWILFFTTLEWFWFFTIFGAVFWILCIIQISQKSEFLLWATCLVGFITLGSFLALGFHDHFNKNRAVVIQPEVSVFSGPGNHNTELFVLHQGSEMDIQDENGEWFRFSLEDGKKGWVHQSEVSRVFSK